MPGVVGVNTTDIVQLPPAASVFPGPGHVVDFREKSPAVEMAEIVSGTLSPFCKVTTCPGPVVCVTWSAKVSLVGDSVTAAEVPVPRKEDPCGEPAASSRMVNSPVRTPTEVGVNVTRILQFSLAGSVFGDTGQSELWAKSPEVEIEAIFTGTVW
jgi:hypothetical protein